MSMKVFALLLGLMAISSTMCDAALVGGRRTYAHYSKCGLWNDPAQRKGFTIEDCCAADVSYPGAPWQQLSVHYLDATNGAQYFRGNAGSCPGFTVLSERALNDASGQVGIEHVYKMGRLTLTKTEQWNFDGQTVKITFKAKLDSNDCSHRSGCSPLRNLTVMHAVDPDQDRVFTGSLSTFSTANDVLYNGGQGQGLYAEATGPSSCQSFAYGICKNNYGDGSTERVGFTQGWDTDPLTGNIFDPSGQVGDYALHYQHNEGRDLHCGDEREFSFFVTWGRCYSQARDNFLLAHKKMCNCPDVEFSRIQRVPRCRNRCPCPTARSGCTCVGSCVLGASTALSFEDIRVLAAERLAPSACDPRVKSSRGAAAAARILAETNPNIKTASRCGLPRVAASEEMVAQRG